MKTRIFIALLSLSLLCPIVSSAQLITTSQTTTTTKTVKKTRKVLDPVARGFEHSVEFTNRMLGDDAYYIGGLDYILGYRFGNYLFLGGGLGLNFPGNDCFIGIPVYLHGRTYFTKTRCQPYFSLSTGVVLTEYFSFFINPMAGVNYRISNTVGIYLAMGYNFDTHQANQFEISLGCTFSTSDVKKVINDAKHLITDK